MKLRRILSRILIVLSVTGFILVAVPFIQWKLRGDWESFDVWIPFALLIAFPALSNTLAAGFSLSSQGMSRIHGILLGLLIVLSLGFGLRWFESLQAWRNGVAIGGRLKGFFLFLVGSLVFQVGWSFLRRLKGK